MYKLHEPVGDAKLVHHGLGALQVDRGPLDAAFNLASVVVRIFKFVVVLYVGEDFVEAHVPTETNAQVLDDAVACAKVKAEFCCSLIDVFKFVVFAIDFVFAACVDCDLRADFKEESAKNASDVEREVEEHLVVASFDSVVFVAYVKNAECDFGRELEPFEHAETCGETEFTAETGWFFVTVGQVFESPELSVNEVASDTDAYGRFLISDGWLLSARREFLA